MSWHNMSSGPFVLVRKAESSYLEDPGLKSKFNLVKGVVCTMILQQRGAMELAEDGPVVRLTSMWKLHAAYKMDDISSSFVMGIIEASRPECMKTKEMSTNRIF